MNEKEDQFLRASFDLAWAARQKGNHPFGAVLVDGQGQVVLGGENTVVTASDATGHAETNLVRQATARYDAEFLGQCTLYASTEPCPMCAAAIFWAGIRRVVFGLSQARLYAMGSDENAPRLILSCREVFSRGNLALEVEGPLLEDEAAAVHEGFW